MPAHQLFKKRQSSLTSSRLTFPPGCYIFFFRGLKIGEGGGRTPYAHFYIFLTFLTRPFTKNVSPPPPRLFTAVPSTGKCHFVFYAINGPWLMLFSIKQKWFNGKAFVMNESVLTIKKVVFKSVLQVLPNCTPNIKYVFDVQYI